jgi:hypothetical protein
MYELFAAWADRNRVTVSDYSTPIAKIAYKQAAEQALSEIKRLHDVAPKYTFAEESQQEVIDKYGVDVLRFDATYIEHPDETRCCLLDQGESLSVTDFVSRYFRCQGFDVMFLESRPFHTLFAVFMWPLIQDPEDPRVRVVGFGDRTTRGNKRAATIWTPLPADFGSPGYALRRAAWIEAHFTSNIGDRDELKRLFDYWLEPSHDLRRYLWAHATSVGRTCWRIEQMSSGS